MLRGAVIITISINIRDPLAKQVTFTLLIYLLTSTCLEITINIRGIIAKQMDWNKFLPRKIFYAHYFWACEPE